MWTLRFPDNELANLFWCSTCEDFLPNGEKRLHAVFMDGTTAGILGQLPSFYRCKFIVSHPGRSVLEQQYLLPVPMHRKFVDALFNSAKHGSSTSSLPIGLDRKMAIRVNELLPLFFDESVPITADRFVAANLIQKWYPVVLPNTPKPIQKPFDEEVRRSNVEFGRCFLSGSIASGSLRSLSSRNAIACFIPHIRAFHQCQHLPSSSTPCEMCAIHLLNASKSVHEYIYLVSRLTNSIESKSSNLRGFARAVEMETSAKFVK